MIPIADPAQIHEPENSHASVLASLELPVKARSAGKVTNIKKSFINVCQGEKIRNEGEVIVELIRDVE